MGYEERRFFAFASKLVILSDETAHNELYSQENDLRVAHWLSDARAQGRAIELTLPQETSTKPIVAVISNGNKIYVVHSMPEDIEDMLFGDVPDTYVPFIMRQYPTEISVL